MNVTVKPIQVAIADDSDVIRARLMQKLSQLEGIKMAWQAQNAAEALAAFQQLKPEVAILDIQMPGGCGIDVLAHIKKRISPYHRDYADELFAAAVPKMLPASRRGLFF